MFDGVNYSSFSFIRAVKNYSSFLVVLHEVKIEKEFSLGPRDFFEASHLNMGQSSNFLNIHPCEIIGPTEMVLFHHTEPET